MSNVLRNRRPTSGPEAEKDTGQLTTSLPQRTFMSLPTEIHLAVSKFLIYPDALSLKHTNAHFYSLVDTGIKLKVEWLGVIFASVVEVYPCSCDEDENMSNVNLDQA
ncbi:hypothetical protein ACHAPI_006596 [Fusarium lateritium]